jgi:crotonobetainyl-CoA:carnitine CoA-transferase CaiB-like acyl-CoA transferase
MSIEALLFHELPRTMTKATQAPGADTTMLEGVRILDMTSVFMGPYATQILGDFGADVIKVEAPKGDSTRAMGPMRNRGMGYVFLNLNRNKRSVVLDLKKPEGLRALYRLAGSADVLVSNVRPRALAKLGVSVAELRRQNARIVVATLVGFAQDGPYAHRPAFDDLIQGLTAVPSMLVDSGAEHPIYVPLAFNDLAVGGYACSAILAALYKCSRTGRGVDIEIPMFETMAQATLLQHMAGLTFDPPQGPPGYRRMLTAERRPFATRDGFVCIVVYTDDQWRRFLSLIGQDPRIELDPRLRDIAARTLNAAELNIMIGAELKQRTTSEWLELLDRHDIPYSPLHTLETLFQDPHLRATSFFRTVQHPSEGPITDMAIPGAWSGYRPRVRHLAPRLGEHSGEILAEAGYSPEEIDQLVASGASQRA